MQSLFCYFFKTEGYLSPHLPIVNEYLKALNNNDGGKKKLKFVQNRT
ncbi:MAG: hypothetical protein PWR04_1073 [Anaerophaga sp.]|nr:hypothetical protein [Anaerophaga sp.]